MKVDFAHTPQEIENILDLRFKILREPWAQPKGSESDGNELETYNAFIKNDAGKILACGRLQLNNDKVAQIRYMAVDNSAQGKGLGKLILKSLEEKAKELGSNKIELQARENALDFYKSNNYLIKEKTHLLFGEIQHYAMEKLL